MAHPVTILGSTVLWPTTGETGYGPATNQFVDLVATAVAPISGLYNTTTGQVGNLGYSNSGQLTLNGVPLTNVGTVTSVAATGANGITVTGSPITSSGTLALSLANTTVTAGSYTNANITVNAQGRITSAANGSAGGVISFNTRTGAITLIGADVVAALGFTPYNATNPLGFTTNTGTVTSVSGAGGTTGMTLTGGPITTTGTLTLGGTLGIANGGTGWTTAIDARNALLPSQTGNSGKFLTTDGFNVSWATSSFSGTLAIANGGTGATTAFAAANNLLPTTTLGDMIYHTGGGNVRLAIGAAGRILTVNGGAPAWIAPVFLTSVSGTATRVSSTGGLTPVIDLVTTAVTPGSYTAANITVDAYGRITAAANGGSGTVTSVSGSGGTTGLSLTGGPITTSGTLTLGGTLGIVHGGTGQTSQSGAINALVPTQGGNSGKYLFTNGSVVSWLDATVNGTAGRISSTGGTNPTVDLVTTAVTPASYTNANITVDAYGRITSASNGSGGGGSGTVTDVSVVTANGVSGSVATSTTTPAITLTLGAITPTSVAAVGTVTGSNLSGTNTGDQTLNSLLPTQTGNNGKFLTTDGANASWDTVAPGGVTSFNTRTGAITLTDDDVTTALTYIPSNNYGYQTISATAYEQGVSPATFTFTVDTGLSYVAGQVVYMQYGVTPNWARHTATVNSYNSGTGALNVTVTSFSNTVLGAVQPWFVNLEGIPGNGTVTTILTGTGLSGGPLSSTGTISLANTAVTPGSYTYSSITVDAQGRLTAASNGTAPTTSISSLTAATANNSIENGLFAQEWKFKPNATDGYGLRIKDTSTVAGGYALLEVVAKTGSTAFPLYVNDGTNDLFTVDTVGKIIAAGGAEIKSSTSTLSYNSVNGLEINNGSGVNFAFTPLGEISLSGAEGVVGQVLTSNGTGAAATWETPAAGGGTSYTLKPVRVASTANGALATAFDNASVVDGVTLVTGDRILLKDQTTGSENGVYTVEASGAPTRVTEFTTGADTLTGGIIVPVIAGTLGTGSQWQCSNTTAITIGTTAITFIRSTPQGWMKLGTEPTTLPTAAGSAAIAIGSGAVAGATTSIAIGSGATANNVTNAIAIGTGAVGGTTSQGGGIAIGPSANANGFSNSDNIAIGNAASVLASSLNSNSSIAIGTSAVAKGASAGRNLNYGIAIGNAASATAATTGANYGNTAIGFTAAANQSGSVAIGPYAKTDMSGQISFSTGNFAAVSDNTIGMIQMWMTTTNATVTELKTTSGTLIATVPTGVIVLSNNSTYIFDCDIVARKSTTGTDYSAWNVKFCINREANAASTALVGTVTKTLLGQTSGASTWDVTVTADTTNGRPNISVTGQAATTIRWVNNVRLTKVSG